MIPIAKAIDEADARLAAEYFRSIPATRGIRIIETNTVPVTHPGPHGVQLVDASGAKEPIGVRIIEVPEDVQRTLLRDATSGFIAYVPEGSIKRGELLAKTGDAGRTLPCATCHGEGLKGMGDLFPPLAGHSPSATARQLYDFKSGARDGAQCACDETRRRQSYRSRHRGPHSVHRVTSTRAIAPNPVYPKCPATLLSVSASALRNSSSRHPGWCDWLLAPGAPAHSRPRRGHWREGRRRPRHRCTMLLASRLPPDCRWPPHFSCGSRTPARRDWPSIARS